MRVINFADAQKEQIVTLYRDGKTQAAIAELLKVSQSTINRKLMYWGYNNNDSNRFNRVAVDAEELKDMYWVKEMHPYQISKVYGCSKQTIINKMKQFNIPFRTKSQSRIGKLNPMYGVVHTEDSKIKISDSFSNGKRSSIGFSGNWGKPTIYTNSNGYEIRMRSGWEVKTANYLSNLEISWVYETIWLDLGDVKYLPDFYLSDHDIFIEVKGRNREQDIYKVELANNTGYKVLLWTAEELLKRGIIDNSGNTELNKRYRNKEIFIDDWNL